jgi:excisionase family DNA binding protein
MGTNNGTNGHKNGKASDTAEDLHDKQVFTTGEAAEVCKVSQQTIIRCFDAGRLKGFRVPGSRFRRIPREELIRFMKANEIPTDAFGGGKRKVLVVDDDPEIVELFKDVFGQDGRFELETASTGYDAGLMTTDFKPDLMILDYMLPDINGNMVCKTVRKNPKLNGMKVLIVSGVVNRDEIDELLGSGADDFIKKPFDLEELMARVESLIEA